MLPSCVPPLYFERGAEHEKAHFRAFIWDNTAVSLVGIERFSLPGGYVVVVSSYCR